MLTAVLLSCLFALWPISVYAAEAEICRKEARIIFAVNRYDIDAGLESNAAALDTICSFLELARADSSVTITGISYSGYASPEGRLALNMDYARKRMAAIERFVDATGNCPSLDSVTRTCEVIGLPMLEELIEKSGIEHREKVLGLLRDDTSPASMRIQRLRNMYGGGVWREIVPLLEELRYASVSFSYLKRMPRDTPLREAEAPIESERDAECSMPIDSATLALEDSAITAPVSEPVRKPFYMALKTNMLYDVLLIPGGGAEFWLGKKFSVSAYWSYAWWSKNRRHNYWRYYGGDIALRRWLGRKAAEKPLTGHHVGIYAQIMTYDFELGGKGYMGNKFNYGGGVEYGFTLPVARRLNIDFTLGVGYLGGKYYEYTPIDGHYVWQATKRRRWFGPTKAEVSLVWLIGYGNHNRPKGGGAGL